MEKSSKKRGRPMLWVLTAILTLGVLAAAAYFTVFHINHFSLELVLTGRNPTKAMLSAADYISEIRSLRHPYERGVDAREGIEF